MTDRQLPPHDRPCAFYKPCKLPATLVCGLCRDSVCTKHGTREFHPYVKPLAEAGA